MISRYKIQQQYGIGERMVKNIFMNVKPAMTKGTSVFYDEKVVADVMKKFFDAPRKPPEGHAIKMDCRNYIGIGNQKMVELFNSINAPKPAGQYFNGQKFINYYKISEVVEFAEHGDWSDEIDDESKWPIPTGPKFTKTENWFMRRKWVNP